MLLCNIIIIMAMMNKMMMMMRWTFPPSFLLMMPNVWLKFQAPIVMGMVVVAPTVIATFDVHIEKKDKMREWEEREKRKGHEPPCVFFSHTMNYGVFRPPFQFNSLRSFTWKSNWKITKLSNETIICLRITTRM